MARKDRRGAAAHNTDEVLTDKHSTDFVPPKCVSLEEALVTIDELIGCENVRAVSRMFHKIVVFVSKVHLAHVVVQNGLVLGDDRYVPVSTFYRRCLRKKFFKNSVSRSCGVENY